MKIQNHRYSNNKNLLGILFLIFTSEIFSTTICYSHTIKTSLQQPAFLGYGYDGLKHQLKPHQCVKGKPEFKQVDFGTSEFTKVENWHQLKNQLNFNIPGSVYLDSDNETAKFAFRARDTFLSATFLLTHTITVSNQVLTEPEELELIKKQSDKDFRERCGNQYVSNLVQGGKLFVGFKFSFANAAERQAFDSGGSVKALPGLGPHVKSLAKDIKQHCSVEIFFHQIGGDLADLASMFDSQDVLHCSLSKFDECERIINKIWSYSRKNFSKAVITGKSQTISHQVASYEGREQVFEEPAVTKERRKILEELDRHTYDTDVISSVQGNSQIKSTCDPRCLASLSSKISANTEALKESIALSFENPKRFLEYGLLDSIGIEKYKMPNFKNQVVAGSILEKPWLWTAVGAVSAIMLPLILTFPKLMGKMLTRKM